MQENAGLCAQNSNLQSEKRTLIAQCIMAGTEIHNLKRQINTRDKTATKHRKLNTDAWWLNSNEGLRMVEEQEALQAAEEQKKREAREQRAAKEAECEAQRQ